MFSEQRTSSAHYYVVLYQSIDFNLTFHTKNATGCNCLTFTTIAVNEILWNEGPANECFLHCYH